MRRGLRGKDSSACWPGDEMQTDCARGAVGSLLCSLSAYGTLAKRPEFPARGGHYPGPPGDTSLEIGCLPGIRMERKGWGAQVGDPTLRL